MKESIGGVFQLQVAIVLIVILLVVFSFGTKYVQAFRTKNFMIDQLEAYEGFNDQSGEAIVNLLESTDYFLYTDKGREDLFSICYVSVDSMGHKGVYYKVKTLINYQFPVVNLNLNFNLKGETRLIYTDKDQLSTLYEYGVNQTIEIETCN